MQEYIDYWKHAFNLHEDADQMTFMIIIGLHLAVSLLSYILGLGWILLIYTALNIIPTSTLTIRRLRTTKTSLKYLFWLFLPVIGLVMVVMKCMDDSIGGGIGDATMEGIATQVAQSHAEQSNPGNKGL